MTLTELSIPVPQTFPSMFRQASGNEPYPFQVRLACGPSSDLNQGTSCQSQLIDIPTGLGKTAAVVMAWLWNRVLQPDKESRKMWPRRLVYCLPMRTLVDQTKREAEKWIFNLGLQVPVHVLMGGTVTKEWDRVPEQPAMLIGTQDMLLSRALNRGYGMSRYRWPVHFALINNDCLWVFDETQLMGVAVETSAQLEAFRSHFKVLGRCPTWWMSATLLEHQMQTIDLPRPIAGWRKIKLNEDDRALHPVDKRLNAIKNVSVSELTLFAGNKSYPKELAKLVLSKHKTDSLSIVVLNQVERAQRLYEEVSKSAKNVPVALIHSRFRPQDRLRQNKFLELTNGILIATQVIEAGIDLSSRLLITELAPWSSIVQRLGRCNRRGDYTDAEMIWVNIPPNEKSVALPYDEETLKLSRSELLSLKNASPAELSKHAVDSPKVQRPIIRRKDFLELFDTTADLSGKDLDISRYVRDEEDNDVQVFWREFDGEPSADIQSKPNELCRVSIKQAQVFFKKLADSKSKRHFYKWNGLEDKWSAAEAIVPGFEYLLPQSVGGYADDLGWTNDPKHLPSVITEDGPTGNEPYADSASSKSSFTGEPQLLADHTREVFDAVTILAISLDIQVPLEPLQIATLWHDVGKAHPIFQSMFDKSATILAKGKAVRSMRRDGVEVTNFRHELASALAFLQQTHADVDFAALVAYLIAAHHGKVRMSLRSLPNEIPLPKDPRRLFARGIWDGDQLPSVHLDTLTVPGVTLDLSPMQMGDTNNRPSWAESCLQVLDQWGPYRLALLETLVRVADWRASQDKTVL